MVRILVRENIFTEFKLTNPVRKAVGVKADLQSGHLHIITTYESPTNDTFPSEFYVHLFQNYTNLVILGDLNAKHTEQEYRITTRLKLCAEMTEPLTTILISTSWT